MRLKTAKQYVARILPVLAEHIRAKYYPDFVAPEIEFDNRGTNYGEYFFGSIDGKDNNGNVSWKSRIKITRKSRICAAGLASTLAHELGHALLDQVNPEFRNVNLKDLGYRSLCEGIAEILEEEGAELLREKGLYSFSILGKLKLRLNVYLDTDYWRHKLTKAGLPYDQGEKDVKALRKSGMSLVEIMEHAHEPEFAHSIEDSLKAE